MFHYIMHLDIHGFDLEENKIDFRLKIILKNLWLVGINVEMNWESKKLPIV